MGIGGPVGKTRTRAGSRLPHRAECGSPCPPWGKACCYCGAGEVRGQSWSHYLLPFHTCCPASPFLAETNTHEARLVGPIRFHSASRPFKPSALAPPRYRSQEGSDLAASPKERRSRAHVLGADGFVLGCLR